VGRWGDKWEQMGTTSWSWKQIAKPTIFWNGNIQVTISQEPAEAINFHFFREVNGGFACWWGDKWKQLVDNGNNRFSDECGYFWSDYTYLRQYCGYRGSFEVSWFDLWGKKGQKSAWKPNVGKTVSQFVRHCIYQNRPTICRSALASCDGCGNFRIWAQLFPVGVQDSYRSSSRICLRVSERVWLQ